MNILYIFYPLDFCLYAFVVVLNIVYNWTSNNYFYTSKYQKIYHQSWGWPVTISHRDFKIISKGKWGRIPFLVCLFVSSWEPAFTKGLVNTDMNGNWQKSSQKVIHHSKYSCFRFSLLFTWATWHKIESHISELSYRSFL